ncbi:hypothetical protein ACFDTO_37150 [Microbacteriaceae bacterium 4G12]
MIQENPIVIAISGVSGGGKTTITKELGRHLDSAQVLSFDDYDFDNSPDDICEWVESGANYDEWNLSKLVYDIEYLLSDKKQRLNYILLDYPFAYKNEEVAQFIDYAIFIDTPLDIAMGRRLLRDFTNELKENLFVDIENYISFGRAAYLEMLNTIKPNSDFIIDGRLPIIKIVSEILEKVKCLSEDT